MKTSAASGISRTIPSGKEEDLDFLAELAALVANGDAKGADALLEKSTPSAASTAAPSAAPTAAAPPASAPATSSAAAPVPAPVAAQWGGSVMGRLRVDDSPDHPVLWSPQKVLYILRPFFFFFVLLLSFFSSSSSYPRCHASRPQCGASHPIPNTTSLHIPSTVSHWIPNITSHRTPTAQYHVPS